MADLTKETLTTMIWEIMNHSAYSPDLVLSDFHTSGPMNVHLQKHKCQADDGRKHCPEPVTQSGKKLLCCWHQ
jgi:hypothetical protein